MEFQAKPIFGVLNSSEVTDSLPAGITIANDTITNMFSAAYTYIWRVVDGNATITGLENGRIRISEASVGNLRIGVIANDGVNDSPEYFFDVLVEEIINILPIANAGVDQAVNGGDLVVLDGSLSVDPDGNITDYKWVQRAGGTQYELDLTDPVRPSFTAANQNQEAEFYLVVTDDRGEDSIVDTVLIAITRLNAIPTITITSDKETYEAGEEIVLTANAEDTNVDDELSRLWSSGETTEVIRIIAPSNQTPSSVSRTCEVNDNNGGVASDSITVNINPDAALANQKIKGHILKYILSIPSLKVNSINKALKMLYWPHAKDPSDVEFFSIELDTNWLIAKEITNATIVATTESQLTIDQLVIDANIITVRISGGVVGSHKIEVMIESAGRTRQFSVYLVVEEK